MGWVFAWMFVFAYVGIGLKIGAIFFRRTLESHRRVMEVGLGDEVFFGFVGLMLGLLAWPLIVVSYTFAQVAKKGLNGQPEHERIRRY